MNFRTLITLSVLSACGRASDTCFQARTGDESSCEVFDTSGRQWDLHSFQQIENLESLCAARCIDVPSGRVSVGGYEDLREVPLLAKTRYVDFLAVDVEGLSDLRGLEQVDISRKFTLSTHGGDLTTFSSLEGLTDRDIESLSIDQVLGLTEFDGARFSRLGDFASKQSGLRRIELSAHNLNSVSLTGLQELRELSLGSGTLDQINLFACSALPAFSWQPGLRTSSYDIQNNSALSSCLVQDFISATVVPPSRLALALNNGPCP